ncbi:type IV pilin [Halopiger xanaduensis]|uniref:Flagellin domain protein n=1 Tax=Halopiger xanaduensis (strain DSM 18323 / JCM 14033 / SH-6) TaxID=797210 RepID=F8DBW9_HALXS|nr:type IV pilin N-terminal domain-containing protein [Halopiger xanaduensis]AEH35945.1 flagellin domain protein [Halopiger xanaduensis SH-6]
MDLKLMRDKLVGSEEQRAVSPVIGVILMVAITVILAAVIATFVLDMGDSMGEGSVNAALDSDVSNEDEEITFTLEKEGNAETFYVRNGDGLNSSSSGSGEHELSFSGTGSTVTLEKDSSSGVLNNTGDVNIVAVDGNAETVIGSVEWDFS